MPRYQVWVNDEPTDRCSDQVEMIVKSFGEIVECLEERPGRMLTFNGSETLTNLNSGQNVGIVGYKRQLGVHDDRSWYGERVIEIRIEQ